MFKLKKNKTMKKIYEAPVTEEVIVEPQLLQAASPGTLDPDSTISNSDGFGSREGNSIFDDGEDY